MLQIGFELIMQVNQAKAAERAPFYHSNESIITAKTSQATGVTRQIKNAYFSTSHLKQTSSP